jgi:DNA-binding NarL/FixJ family response regulator
MLRAVLVDDVEDLRALVRTRLELDGRFTVIGEGGNGREGVEVSRATQPDVILLDIDMPELDGLATLPELRVAAPLARIIMLSGLPAADLERPSLERGAVGYVEKSGDLRDLAAQIHHLAEVLATAQHVLDSLYAFEPTSPRDARHDLRDALRDLVDPSALEVVELLVTELVTNAVHHAHSEARVSAAIQGDRVRVNVSDANADVPATPEGGPADDDEHGRGMFLVDSLASAWGIATHTGGKTIWFEVDVRS